MRVLMLAVLDYVTVVLLLVVPERYYQEHP